MSIREETVIVPATTRTRISGKYCDLCGKKSPSNCVDSWSDSNYAINEVTIQHCTGERYPGEGHSVSEVFDICPECYKTKVVPWLAEQGAVPRTTEVDW